MDFLNTLLDTLLKFLLFLLSTPETTAAAIGVGCAFGVRNVYAATVSVLTGAGLLWTGHPVLAGLVAAALTLAWLIDCAFYTERDCLRCGGGGRFKRAFWWSPTSKTCRGLFGCGGASRKVRLGTRILTRMFGDHFV